MHIAFVTPEFNRGDEVFPGGLANYIFNISSGLIERGHKVTVFVSGHIDRRFSFNGIEVVEVPLVYPWLCNWLVPFCKKKFPVSFERTIRSWNARNAIIKYLSEEKLDILQYTNWKAIGVFKLHFPSVIRISSFEPYFDNNPGVVHLDKRLARFIEGFSIKRFQHVFGPGDYLNSIIETDLKLRKPIDILPTPFISHDLDQASNFKKQGKFLVVYAGTVCKFKGYELLEGIIDEYCKKYDDTIFILVGKVGTMDGKSLDGRIQALTQRLQGKVSHLPHLNKGSLLKLFRESDAVLIPSLIDNFPNTAIEALSQNANVIATNTSSLGTLIENQVNGYIISQNDPNIWIQCIRNIFFNMSEPDKEEFNKQIKKKLEKFSIDTAVCQLIDYYRSVLKK